MKAILHANVDGQEIVLGFGEAHGLIDPVATAIKIAPIVQAADETKQMTALNAQINAVRQSAGQAFALADQARLRGDAATMTRQNGEYQAKLMEIAELEKQLPAIVGAFEAMRARVTVDNAAYAHPPQGEDLIDDAQAKDMQAKHALRGDGQQLLMTGEYVTDLRGRDFYIGPPWKHMVIDTLGEDLPKGAIMTDQLTDAQRAEISVQEEADRIAALSPADRDAEAQRAKDGALAQAAVTRSQLEIAGDTKALAKSQAEYQDAVAGIAEKYGI